MKYVGNIIKKMSVLLVVPILIGCGQKVTGLSNACPLPGVYNTTVLKATEEKYKDVLVIGTAKYFVEEKIDIGTGYVLGISHIGEACLLSEDFLHYFNIEKSVYDQASFELTVEDNHIMTVKSQAEIQAEKDAEAAALLEEQEAAAAAAAAKEAGISTSSSSSDLKMPVEAPPAPVPVY